MSGRIPWSEIKAKSKADPAKVAEERRAIERELALAERRAQPAKPPRRP